MVTSNSTVTCPKCQAVNDYVIQKVEVIDANVAITYMCACGCHYTNIYALTYMGGYTDDYYYDRDNLKVNY
jgi:hypothetical protein